MSNKKYIDNHRKNIYFRNAELIKIIEDDAARNNKSFGDVLIDAYCKQNKNVTSVREINAIKEFVAQKNSELNGFAKKQTADMKVNRGSRYEVKA